MERASGPAKFAVFQLHKSVGITILLLMLLRIAWKLRRRPLPLKADGWERALATAVHLAFYLLLLAMPLSGWLVVSASRVAVPTLLYGTVPLPHVPVVISLAAETREGWYRGSASVHSYLSYGLYVLIGLHVAGALKHHFLDRDGSFARMAPGIRPGSLLDPRLLLIGAAASSAAVFGFGWARGRNVHRPVQSVEATPPRPATPVQQARQETYEQAAAAAPDAPVAAEDVPSWTIEDGSSLSFSTSWAGEPIEGGFRRFRGSIEFSPDQLDRSSVAITVDIGTVYTGDSSRDETLKGGEWFAVGTDRNAVFRAERFRSVGRGRYVAEGTLRMKGATAPLSMPFTLQINGNRALVEGSAVVDRLAYRIGEGEYASTAEIPADVTVRIRVEARRR
jgi:cytochrome b561/polyisoprenoid-binding protein YceI